MEDENKNRKITGKNLKNQTKWVATKIKLEAHKKAIQL